MSARGIGPAGIGRHAAAVCAIVALFAAALFAASGWAPKGVTVVVDGKARTSMTAATTVGEVLASHGLAVEAGDLVTPRPDAAIRDGMTIVLRRPKPVTVTVGDRAVALRVVGDTVADALVAAGSTPGDALLVTPDVSTLLAPGMRIVARSRWNVRRVEPYPVAFHTLVKEDPSLPDGSRTVIQEGRTGRGERVYSVHIEEGRPVTRSLKSDSVVLAPRERIIAVGTDSAPHYIGSYTRSPLRFASYMPTAPAQVSPPPARGDRLEMLVTAYSAGHGSGDYAYSGLLCRQGVIAVDPDVVPLGTRLYVPGYGFGLAADTGGAIKGRHIDICFDHESQCEDWGQRTLTVTIIR